MLQQKRIMSATRTNPRCGIFEGDNGAHRTCFSQWDPLPHHHTHSSHSNGGVPQSPDCCCTVARRPPLFVNHHTTATIATATSPVKRPPIVTCTHPTFRFKLGISDILYLVHSGGMVLICTLLLLNRVFWGMQALPRGSPADCDRSWTANMRTRMRSSGKMVCYYLLSPRTRTPSPSSLSPIFTLIGTVFSPVFYCLFVAILFPIR
jgi:hypothetical protein